MENIYSIDLNYDNEERGILSESDGLFLDIWRKDNAGIVSINKAYTNLDVSSFTVMTVMDVEVSYTFTNLFTLEVVTVEIADDEHLYKFCEDLVYTLLDENIFGLEEKKRDYVEDLDNFELIKALDIEEGVFFLDMVRISA